jgi:hypothetical protein
MVLCLVSCSYSLVQGFTDSAGFCMSRIVTCTIRISSICLPHDISLSIAAAIFVAAGEPLLVPAHPPLPPPTFWLEPRSLYNIHHPLRLNRVHTCNHYHCSGPELLYSASADKDNRSLAATVWTDISGCRQLSPDLDYAHCTRYTAPWSTR